MNVSNIWPIQLFRARLLLQRRVIVCNSEIFVCFWSEKRGIPWANYLWRCRWFCNSRPTARGKVLERSKKDPACPLPGLDIILVSIQWILNPLLISAARVGSRASIKEKSPQNRSDWETGSWLLIKRNICQKNPALSFPSFIHTKKQHFTTFFYIEIDVMIHLLYK